MERRIATSSSEPCCALEREAQTEARHERVDGERRFPEAAAIGGREAVLGYFRNDCLRVGQIEEIDRRSEMPTFVKHELAREAQVQLIHAGQALNASRLQDDVFGHWNALSIINVECRGRLNGEAGVVLEVDAGTKFPRQFI